MYVMFIELVIKQSKKQVKLEIFIKNLFGKYEGINRGVSRCAMLGFY